MNLATLGCSSSLKLILKICSSKLIGMLMYVLVYMIVVRVVLLGVLVLLGNNNNKNNSTVEPLLYDHPQNHIGVVV